MEVHIVVEICVVVICVVVDFGLRRTACIETESVLTCQILAEAR